MPQNTQIQLLETAVFAEMVHIRYQGQITEYWTNLHALKKVETPMPTKTTVIQAHIPKGIPAQVHQWDKAIKAAQTKVDQATSKTDKLQALDKLQQSIPEYAKLNDSYKQLPDDDKATYEKLFQWLSHWETWQFELNEAAKYHKCYLEYGQQRHQDEYLKYQQRAEQTYPTK